MFSSLFAALLVDFESTFHRREFLIYVSLITFFWIFISINLLLDVHSLFFQHPIKTHEETIRQQSTQFALDFLNNVSGNYRYQTFGYNRPIGEIYFYSKLPTLDTDYFTGRTIVWIRDLGVSEIDQIKDEKLLNVFINHTVKYSIKYVITFDDFYFDYFQSRGWNLINQKKFQSKKVAIWENPENIEEVKFDRENYKLINYLRGILPPTLLLVFLLFLIKTKLRW
jgi:hypothetical protein